MDIYFDESRNTGEIGTSGRMLNYFDQRYFILVGYIHNQKMTEMYEKFKSKYLKRIYPNSEELEIKGNDLLTKINNDILDEFIDQFMNGDHLYITIYDKKFFILTSMLVWLFGGIFKDKLPELFYMFCEFLIKADDILFTNFIQTINNKSKKNITKFLEYIINYNYFECLNSSFDYKVKKEFIEIIKTFQGDNDYHDLLMADIIPESINIKGKNRNNIVNLTALGETLLLLKINRNLTNQYINIVHDNIEVIEEYIRYYFDDIPVRFTDSKNSIQVQLSDNVSSVIGKLINSILPIKSDQSIKLALNDDHLWIRNRLSKILNSIAKTNVKIVTQLREQAFIETYSLTDIHCFEAFKIQLSKSLDSRFTTELSNHMTGAQAYEHFKK